VNSYASMEPVKELCWLIQSNVEMKYIKRHPVKAMRRAQIGNRARLCHLDDSRTADMVESSTDSTVTVLSDTFSRGIS
jgi:hypothetical protein